MERRDAAKRFLLQTSNSTTLSVIACYKSGSAIGVYSVGQSSSDDPWDTIHSLCLDYVGQKTDVLEQFDQDIKIHLKLITILRCNIPIIGIEDCQEEYDRVPRDQ